MCIGVCLGGRARVCVGGRAGVCVGSRARVCGGRVVAGGHTVKDFS